MSEHKATIEPATTLARKPTHYRPTCSCGWRLSGHLQGRDRAIAAYQSHVYAAMGREAAELHKEGELYPMTDTPSYGGWRMRCAVFVARLRAALEVPHE